MAAVVRSPTNRYFVEAGAAYPTGRGSYSNLTPLCHGSTCVAPAAAQPARFFCEPVVPLASVATLVPGLRCSCGRGSMPTPTIRSASGGCRYSALNGPCGAGLGSTLTIKLSHGDCFSNSRRLGADDASANPEGKCSAPETTPSTATPESRNEVVKETADFVKDIDYHKKTVLDRVSAARRSPWQSLDSGCSSGTDHQCGHGAGQFLDDGPLRAAAVGIVESRIRNRCDGLPALIRWIVERVKEAPSAQMA
jgi:hypothetical protein